MRRRLLLGGSNNYLTFTAVASGTFKFTNSLQYSIDNGSTWSTLNANTNSPTINAGNKIMWKGTRTASNNNGIGSFSSTANYIASGNPLSLIFGDNFKSQTTTSTNYALARLFFNSIYLINALDLILPATTLTTFCYYEMFRGCTSLTTGPKELPALIAKDCCYMRLFYDCPALLTVPIIKATTLATACYLEMFLRCYAITKAPDLIATTLVSGCYYYMFTNCTSLSLIKALFTTTPSNTYTEGWVLGVASSGTFIKNNSATWNVVGTNGIPSGWTVQTI